MWFYAEDHYDDKNKGILETFHLMVFFVKLVNCSIYFPHNDVIENQFHSSLWCSRSQMIPLTNEIFHQWIWPDILVKVNIYSNVEWTEFIRNVLVATPSINVTSWLVNTLCWNDIKKLHRIWSGSNVMIVNYTLERWSNGDNCSSKVSLYFEVEVKTD